MGPNKNMPKKHIQLFSILAGCVSSASAIVLSLFPSALVFLGVVLFWTTAVLSLFFYAHRLKKHMHWSHLGLLTATMLAMISLLLLIEWQALKWLFVVLSGLCVGVLFQFDHHAHKKQLAFKQKPIRRMFVMLWVFCAFSFVTTIFALLQLFAGLPIWIFSLVIALLATTISAMIWKLYYPGPLKRFLFWGVIMVTLSFEVAFVLTLLPLGYLVLGGIFVWIWYILQLFIRFHMSDKGIAWEKQRWFLVTNGVVALSFFLFLFRWI